MEKKGVTRWLLLEEKLRGAVMRWPVTRWNCYLCARVTGRAGQPCLARTIGACSSSGCWDAGAHRCAPTWKACLFCRGGIHPARCTQASREAFRRPAAFTQGQTQRHIPSSEPGHPHVPRRSSMQLQTYTANPRGHFMASVRGSRGSTPCRRASKQRKTPPKHTHSLHSML